jgi:hypothetical protein
MIKIEKNELYWQFEKVVTIVTLTTLKPRTQTLKISKIKPSGF